MSDFILLAVSTIATAIIVPRMFYLLFEVSGRIVTVAIG